MKIKRFEPDEEGYIHVKNMIGPLTFGLFKGKPAFWCVVDEMGKEGNVANLVCIKDGGYVDPVSHPPSHYRGTFIDQENQIAYHVFEEKSKLVQGSLNANAPKGFIQP